MNEETTLWDASNRTADEDDAALNRTTLIEEDELANSIRDNDEPRNNFDEVAYNAPIVPNEPVDPGFALPSVDTIKQTVSDTTHQAMAQAKDTAGQALDTAKQQVRQQLSAQKDRASTTVDGFTKSFVEVGNSLNSTGQPQLAAYVNSMADQVDRFGDYLRTSDIDQIGRDAQEFARQNPAIVVGGAFFLGIMLARFFKSSATNVTSDALVPVSQAMGITTTPYGTTDWQRQDIDADDAFDVNARPLAAHGYVSGGIVGGAEA